MNDNNYYCNNNNDISFIIRGGV